MSGDAEGLVPQFFAVGRQALSLWSSEVVPRMSAVFRQCDPPAPPHVQPYQTIQSVQADGMMADVRADGDAVDEGQY